MHECNKMSYTAVGAITGFLLGTGTLKQFEISTYCRDSKRDSTFKLKKHLDNAVATK